MVTDPNTTDIWEELRSKVQTDIRDPNDARRKGEEGTTRWVYTLPIDVTIPQYPRLHWRLEDNPKNPRALNDTKRKSPTVFAGKLLYDFDPGDEDHKVEDPLQRGSKIEPQYAVMDFAEHIEAYINDNQSQWENINGVHSVVSTNVIPRRAKKKHVLRVDIELRVLMHTESYEAV